MAPKHLRVADHRSGAILVDLDARDKRLNVLNEEVFHELAELAESWTQNPPDRPVVLRSAKEKGFVVGADLRRIRELTTPEALERFLKLGQQTMRAWSALACPTIAWVRGMALGGGLELALSCRYLIVSDGQDTQLGMPESKLGLLPGWGGTQLLPRRIGLQPALTMLLSGEAVDAALAQSLGLADGLWQAQHESEQLDHWIRQLPPQQVAAPADQTDPAVRPTPEKSSEAIQPPEGDWFGPAVEPEIANARQAILRAVQQGIDKGIQAGMDAERELFWPLLADPRVQARLERFAGKK